MYCQVRLYLMTAFIVTQCDDQLGVPFAASFGRPTLAETTFEVVLVLTIGIRHQSDSQVLALVKFIELLNIQLTEAFTLTECGNLVRRP